MTGRRAISLLIVFLIFKIQLLAQFDGIIQNFDIEDGLIQNSIYALSEDPYGFIWIGTAGGLNRYDGFNYVSFTPNHRDSLNTDFSRIFEIYLDKDSALWICTAGEIYSFDYITETFRELLNADHVKPAANFTGIRKDDHQRLWISTSNAGLVSYNMASHEQSNLTVKDGLISNEINCVFIDSESRIWLGSMAGLIMIETNDDGEADKIRNFTNIKDDPFSISNNVVHKIYQDTEGNLWIGTNNGLSVLRREDQDKNNFRFVHYQANPGNQSRLSHYDIRAISEGSQGEMWIGTRGGGINIIHPGDTGETIEVLFADPFNKNAITHNEVFAILKDRWNNIWAGTHGGLSHIVLSREKFNVIRENRSNPESISSNSISSMIEDAEGNLWIGTTNGINYLSRKDRLNKTFHFTRYLNTDYPSDPVRINKIQSLSTDMNGNIWAGSKGGITLFDPRTSSFNNNNSLTRKVVSVYPDLYVRKIACDPYGNLWLGTAMRGLIYYDFESDSLIPLSNLIHDDRLGQFNNIYDIFLDRDSTIWAGSFEGGLIHLRFDGSKSQDVEYKIYSGDLDDPNSLRSNFITSIFRSSEDMLLVGTSYGLYTMDETEEDFHIFTNQQGLQNNYIAGITEDKTGKIWIATVSGFSMFNKEAGYFVNYKIPFGDLTKVEYTFDLLCTREGELYFGGFNGLTRLLPESNQVYNDRPTIFLSDLLIFNEPVTLQSLYKGNQILSKVINFTDDLTFSHEQNNIGFEFVALKTPAPDQIKFLYMLEGFDDRWYTVESPTRSVNYPNLKPGRYLFKVKSTNSLGILQDNEKQIAITILPPLWKRWWAFIIYVSLFIIMLYLLRLNIVNREKLKNSLMLERLNKEKQEELTQAKLKFFTNISHDFKTPLTLISAPIEDLIKNEKDLSSEDRQRYYRTIRRNSRNLLSLINQLLEFRKAEQETLRLSVSRYDLVELIKTLEEDFSNYARQKSIEFTCTHDVESMELWLDIKKIERAFGNIVSNAFKFTPEGGNIGIHLKKDPSDRHAIIEISDSGKGIPENQLDKIFTRFYQVEDDVHQGSGIGLPLAKTLIEMHGGHISVSSVLDKGSTFSIWLRIGKSHFSEDDFASVAGTEPLIKIIENLAEEPMKKQRDADSGNSIPRILIVEDNAELRNYMAGHLSAIYHIEAVSNGKDAMEILLKNNYQLIISDIMMPEMDGITLCQNVKKNIMTSHIPVILLTAKTSIETKQEGYESGADAFIGKPFTMELLEARIRNILESRKLLKERFRLEAKIEPEEITTTSPDQKFLIKAIDLIEGHLSENEYRIEDFVEDMAMSRSMLYRKLQEITGQSPHEFITSIRFRKAVKLLEQDEYNISEVAFMVGFNDPRYFSRSFRKYFNLTPTEYIQKIRQES